MRKPAKFISVTAAVGVALAGLTAPALVVPAVAATPGSFECPVPEEVIISGGGLLQQFNPTDPSSVPPKPLGTPSPAAFNSIGFNSEDRFVYAIDRVASPRTLLKISSQGVVTDLGAPTGTWPAGGGDFSSGQVYNGVLYTLNVTSKDVYAIELTPPYNATLVINDYGASSGATGSGPFDIVVIDGFGYGVTDSDELITFDLSGGTASSAALTGSTGGPYGAAFNTTTGKYYIYQNSTKSIFNVTDYTTSSPKAVFSRTVTITGSGGIDGASFIPITACDDAQGTPMNTPYNGELEPLVTTFPGSTYAATPGAGPANGSVSIDPATGQYVYTPNNGFTGTDSFDYTVCLPAPNDNVCSTATVTMQVGPAPALALVKTASPTSFTAAGDVITYTITGTNTGPVNILDAQVQDPQLTGLTCTPATPIAVFAPGDQVSCTGTHTVTDAEAAAGVINNTATIVGTGPGGKPVTATGTAQVPQEAPAPVLTLLKSPTPKTFAAVGETITYALTAKNAGTVDLTNVTVSDPKLTGLTCTPAIPVAVLPAGASIVCSGTHVVTADELAANAVDNTAVATGIGPGGVEAVGTGTATVPGPGPAPSLDLTKSVDKAAFSAAGDVLTYTLRAVNNSTQAATNVTVTDPLLTGISCTPATPATLQAGESIECTGTYTVGASDVTAGEVNNTASVSGTGPAGESLSDVASAVVPKAGGAPALNVVKSPSPKKFINAGETITYAVTASNTGSVTLTDVVVSDPMLADLACIPALPVATLAVGESIACEGTYQVTDADVTLGVINNLATATGLSPDGDGVTGTGSTQVTGVDPAPLLTLAKAAAVPSFSAEGQVVSYTITATNSGTSALTNVTVADPMLTGLICTPSLPVATLESGASISCTGTHTVTSAEVTAEDVNNTATATGTGPSGQGINASAIAVLPYVPIPVVDADLGIVKTHAGGASVRWGTTVTYTLTVTNNGPATADTVTVSDPMPRGVVVRSASGTGWTCTVTGRTVDCDRPSLGAGESTTITVVAVPGVEAIGTVRNTATVSSATPDPVPGNNTSTDTLQVLKKPQPPQVNPKPVIANGTLTIAVGKSVAGQQMGLRVKCYTLLQARALPAGDVVPCRVIRRGSTREVVAFQPVQVEVTYFAKALPGWFVYRETKYYKLNPAR